MPAGYECEQCGYIAPERWKLCQHFRVRHGLTVEQGRAAAAVANAKAFEIRMPITSAAVQEIIREEERRDDDEEKEQTKNAYQAIEQARSSNDQESNGGNGAGDH